MFKDKTPKDGLWHKCSAPFVIPVRLIDGTMSNGTSLGQMWKRWNGSGWDYQQDAETEEQFCDRQY